jgi:septum formation protein
MKKIILASQSPRRKQILEWAEVSFDIIVSESDETFPSNLSPAEAAIHIAKNKALAVIKNSNTDLPVLAADTIVVLNSRIIGKPNNRAEAIEILVSLSGKQHQVITGVAILFQQKEILFTDITDVHFHGLSLAQIEYYVDHYKPYDKAGAYAIQEWIGVVGIHSITGDFYNVMGLPVSKVIKALETL